MKQMCNLGLLLFLIPVADGSANAQIIRVQAGSSSLVAAHGGSIQLQAPSYEGAFGIGLVANEVQFGGVVRTHFRGLNLTAGDDVIHFDLPTDVFASTQYFYGRGIGVAQKDERTSFAVFGGATSTVLGAPFFQAAKNDTPFGLFFLESRFSPRLKFVSRTVITDKQTLINGLEFAARSWLKTSISAGIGANAPYGAVSFLAERRLFTLKGSYISASRDFRRASADTPLNSEVYRDNVMLTMNPTSHFGFAVARQNLLSPVTSKQPNVRATVHEGAVFGDVFRFRLNSSIYESTVEGHRNIGYSFAGTRSIGNRLEAGVDFTSSKPDTGSSSQSLTGRVRETITQRFSLIQYVTHSNGQTSLHAGGEFNSIRFSLAISQETAYLPFRAGSAGGPFVRVYNISLRLRPFQQMEFSAQTNVAPDGRVKYTTSVGDYFYHYAGLESGGKREMLRIGRYIVKGIVVDEDDKPVAGAALQIDGQITFTDSEGRFLLRLPKRGRPSLKVLFDDFLTATPYETKSAPGSVQALPEGEAADVVIILRRITDPARLLGLQKSMPPIGTRGKTESVGGQIHPPQQ